MIKNEEKILKRCLEAVENLVDCFCICDTGSTDNSLEIAKEFLKTHKGCLTSEPWKNFGHNRTVSFQNAQTYIKQELNWDLSKTYGLLLDADMVFVNKTLKNQTLTAPGYKIIQLNGNLEYYNCRFVRMDYPWTCVSVTHEYWNGPTENLSKDICFIDDKNDGGCKHDKFERDQKLLEQGLIDEPKNVRYMFYLAQTYKCMNKHEDAIKMYKRRIKAGGWHEEVWYSMYMIGDSYLKIKNVFKFEAWMQLAFQFHSKRSESLYKLAEFFRVNGLHYKAYHYANIGDKIPFPKDDVLFIESDVYNSKFLYEKTVLDFYVHQDKKISLRDCTNYLLKCGNFIQNVISNLKFYAHPISTNIKKIELSNVFGDDFTPSAISIDKYPFANVRFVNYWIDNGEYKTKNEVVQTENAYMNIETGEMILKMKDASILLERFDTNVKGLEDIRLFKYKNQLKFTATSVKEYSKDAVRVVVGDYNIDETYSNVKVLDSPFKSGCEKNWLPISDTDMFIYGWHPFVIVNSKSEQLKTIETPPLFSLFRGSAPPVKNDDVFWTLVHFVEYSKPRRYYHCFVELDKTLVPRKVSLPFVFKSDSIEYCVSFRINKDEIDCFVSFMDKDPCKVIIPSNSLEWILI